MLLLCLGPPRVGWGVFFSVLHNIGVRKVLIKPNVARVGGGRWIPPPRPRCLEINGALTRIPERDCSSFAKKAIFLFLVPFETALSPNASPRNNFADKAQFLPLTSGCQEKKHFFFLLRGFANLQLRPGGLMGARIAPTFIRHKLASILSCSTILRAWPILIVLLTGVSPFILE